MCQASKMLHSTPIQSHLKAQTPSRTVCRWLSFSSHKDSDTSEDATPTPRSTPASIPVCLAEEEEEDFQMIPLKDEQWTTKEVPDRTLYIHEHALPHRLCPYPCPYANYLIPSYSDSLDLSDISDFEDIMIMSSDEDVEALQDTPY